MKRMPFVLKCRPGMKTAAANAVKTVWSATKDALAACGVGNFSVWGVQDFLFFYSECADEAIVSVEIKAQWQEALSGCADVFAAPGTLPLMYHDIGIVREDKSLIRHRVFATKLKEGCAEEYKRRHDALIEARGDKVTEGPESNFTIWNANGYIFGYCELVKSFDHEMTEEEKASNIAWETRQLEIMDWLTDDVDWITGEKHDAIELICR